LTATPTRDDAPWVCCPVSSSPTKDYPAEKWVEVFASLAAERGDKPLLIVGEAQQTETLHRLASTLTNSGIAGVSVITPPCLVSFTNLLASAGCIFSVDTAALHIATALDRPLVVVFSGLHVGMFGPWKRSERQIWIPPDPHGTKRSNWTKRLPAAKISTAARDVVGSPARSNI
jgi:ADP-heptose:LPS heptosyltransferase